MLLTGQHSKLPGPQPVVMQEREIGPPVSIVGGDVLEIRVGDHTASLFIPDEWKGKDGEALWVHFHTAPWFVIQEFQRAGHRGPVAIFNLGQGSKTYARPFEKVGSFAPWRSAFEDRLGITLGRLNFTSFSAGYGAVRNLIADPAVLASLGTVILADSLYGSLVEGATTRQVFPAHVDCWRGLRDRAIAGECTWIVTTSQITPDTYAGTWEVGLALVASVGGKMVDTPGGTASQRLLRSHRNGRWFVWSYAGEDAVAHMTHPRRLAELIMESRKQ